MSAFRTWMSYIVITHSRDYLEVPVGCAYYAREPVSGPKATMSVTTSHVQQYIHEHIFPTELEIVCISICSDQRESREGIALSHAKDHDVRITVE